MMTKINFIRINNELKSDFTIVFLHEGLGCIQSWKNYPEELCKTLNVKGIVYDRPGYGKSKGNLMNRSNDYLIQSADDLDLFLKSLHLKQIIIYGHSDGGSIALAYAATYKENLICIITEAAHVLNEKTTISGIKKVAVAFEKGKLDGLIKWHGHAYKNIFEAWSKTWLRKNFDLISLKKLLSNIQVNQLIIQGKNDQYGTIEQVRTIARHTVGKTDIITPNCAHSPFLESSKEILPKVVSFIKNQINAGTQNRN